MQQVILAAGKGSRLNAQETNKCLVKVHGKRLIEYNLELSKYINASEILIIVGYNKEYIMEYIGDSYNGIPVKYIIQEPQLGIAHGVLKASSNIYDSFFMCLSDEILISPKIHEQMDFFNNYKADCVCGVVKDNVENIQKAYTVNLTKENTIKQIIEKPKEPYNCFKGTGYCMMGHIMLDCLASLHKNQYRGEYEMGDWINLAIKKKYKCFAYEIGQADFNINETVDLKNAEKFFENQEMKS